MQQQARSDRTTTRRRGAAGMVAAALLAIGCSGGGGNAAESAEADHPGNAVAASGGAGTNSAAAQGPALQVHEEGLRLAGPSAGQGAGIAFGATQDEVLAQLAFLGEPEVATNEECGAGPMQIARWPNGLSLLFQDGRFAGWSVDGRGENRPATTQGIDADGSSRAELEAAYPGANVEESSLGQEFAAGGIGGLLDGSGPEAKVTAMWAGTTCMFR